MSDYNEQTLMEAVIKRVAATPDPRLRQIMTSLVTHLHGFVREVRPTWEELLAGIQFLTAVGQKCDDKRQEFILLSDSLGVSMLVDLVQSWQRLAMPPSRTCSGQPSSRAHRNSRWGVILPSTQAMASLA